SHMECVARIAGFAFRPTSGGLAGTCSDEDGTHLDEIHFVAAQTPALTKR
ncbi:MAG: hypothetical protein ACJAYU_003677, partial [Bradymonadia bacterium]